MICRSGLGEQYSEGIVIALLDLASGSGFTTEFQSSPQLYLASLLLVRYFVCKAECRTPY